MNLWGNRLGQLLTIAVALFFFSCEDEKNLLGYKNPTSKFKTYTVEIPLESSVMIMDSVKSSNGVYQGETDRLLVGDFDDPDLGNVRSTGIMQFFSFAKDTIWGGATLDSARLIMPFDTYHYGADVTGYTLDFAAHRVETKLDYNNKRHYISRTEVKIGEQIANTSMYIIRDSLGDTKTIYDSLIIPFPKDGAYVQELWKVVNDYKQNVNDVYASVEKFTNQFKGIALSVQEGSNQMVGIKALSSQLILYYHAPNQKGEVKKYTVAFKTQVASANPVLVTYSHIVGDRSSSPLAGMTNFKQEFDPGNGKRYVQAGTGIVTKLNFSKFYDFLDTISESAVINEAEISLGALQVQPASQEAPIGFTVRMLRPQQYGGWEEWRIPPKYHVDSLKLARFRGFMVRDYLIATGSTIQPPMVDLRYVATMASDSQDPYSAKVLIKYATGKSVYVGYPTLYFQQAMLKENRDFTEFSDAIIYPLVKRLRASTTEYDGTGAAKAINKAVFDAQNIKLTITYTKPTVEK